MITTLTDGTRVRLLFQYIKQYSLEYKGKCPKELETIKVRLQHFSKDRLRSGAKNPTYTVYGIPAEVEITRFARDKENRVLGREIAVNKLLEKVPFSEADRQIIHDCFTSSCRTLMSIADA
jgi:hypothetical protein